MRGMDVAPSCEIGIPGVQAGGGPGWYLVARSTVVEAGPFPCIITALHAAAWLHHQGRGVNPAPWLPVKSKGLVVGSRRRVPGVAP